MKELNWFQKLMGFRHRYSDITEMLMQAEKGYITYDEFCNWQSDYELALLTNKVWRDDLVTFHTSYSSNKENRYIETYLPIFAALQHWWLMRKALKNYEVVELPEKVGDGYFPDCEDDKFKIEMYTGTKTIDLKTLETSLTEHDKNMLNRLELT